MSKLSQLQNFRYQPAAGGLLSFIPKALGGLVNTITGLNIIKPKVAPPAAAITPMKAPTGTSAAVRALIGGGGTTRRAKGISGRELRGFRKVARLLHKEGMVSKKARGR